MTKTSYLIPVIAVAIIFGGCRRNEAKERIQAQRDAWEASLPDSLSAVEHQLDSIRSEIKSLSQSVEEMLPAFDYVDNPREVEGYYIAREWAPAYPLSRTGLVARLTKSEKLELIAALSGAARFDRIRVEVPGEKAETSVVPPDQALNYRMDGLNIVCFSDSAASACASLIARHAGEDITIVYLEGGKKTGTLRYPARSQTVMADTWRLYDTRSRLLHDERMIPLLARKGAILTEKIDKIKAKE